MSPDPDLLDPKLLIRLRSKKPAEREEAERELLSLGPSAVDRLLKTLDAEVPVRRRNRWIGAGVIAAWILLIVGLAAVGFKGAGGMGGAVSGIVIAFFAATTTQKNAAGALARFDDKRAVGPLTDALEYQDKDVVAAARGALTRMLPTLRASDHGLLTTQQRRILDRALTRRKQADLSLAILRAYEQVGDKASIPVVERLAAGETGAARDQRVVDLARGILPGLRGSAEMVHAAQTLLRPAAPATGADTLLRPLSPGAASGSETLLRPTEAPSDEAVRAERADDDAKSTEEGHVHASQGS